VAAERDDRFELPDSVLLCHELRSHLAAVNLGASHLRRQLAAEDPELIRALDIIDRAVGRATELTTWVLDASYQESTIDLDGQRHERRDEPVKPPRPRAHRPDVPQQGPPPTGPERRTHLP